MTKVWKQISFWNKIKMTLGTCGAGGELAVVLNDMPAIYHTVVVSTTIVGIIITQFVQDTNNDGVVDLFEDKKEPNGEDKKL